MAKARSLYVKVAGGPCHGGQWALYWPAWKWQQLTPDEQAAVIARQQALIDRSRRATATAQNGR